MGLFLSTKTIESAYKRLSGGEIQQPNIIFTFLILKACDFNTLNGKSVKEISETGRIPTHNLSRLFSPQEKAPNKYNFINPFSMDAWHSQTPSEDLDKWVKNRITNNIIGGARVWRTILDHDPTTDTVKFQFDYLNEIVKQNDIKFNLPALAVWSHKFSDFDSKLSFPQLLEKFKNDFYLTEEEIDKLFTVDQSEIIFDFQEKIHDTSYIRGLIGVPPGENNTWIQSERAHQPTTLINASATTGEIIMSEDISFYKPYESIKPLLDQYFQVILMGPPGTSKSYFADKTASEFFKPSNVKKIQFHPSYSYSNFMGGYFVDGTNVQWSDGILYSFVQEAKENSNHEYLLVIEEINRANTPQVFGEMIQCLDRDSNTSIRISTELVRFSIPKNLKIIGTMNTADRSIGVVDFAIRRRFASIYMQPDHNILNELSRTDFGISLGEFMHRLNRSLIKNLKNKELTIGHAIFLDNRTIDEETKYHTWNSKNFEYLFNFKILPLIEDFTRGNTTQLESIIGTSLTNRITGSEFINQIRKFVKDEN